jgi:hypothetical protein
MTALQRGEASDDGEIVQSVVARKEKAGSNSAAGFSR